MIASQSRSVYVFLEQQVLFLIVPCKLHGYVHAAFKL